MHVNWKPWSLLLLIYLKEGINWQQKKITKFKLLEHGKELQVHTMTGNNNMRNKPQFIGKTRWEVYTQQISATFHEILLRIDAACLTTYMSKSSCNIFHSHVQCSSWVTAFWFEQHSSLKQGKVVALQVVPMSRRRSHFEVWLCLQVFFFTLGCSIRIF